MDLSCIISSGDLELYVLGMLPEDEAQKITQLAAILPEVQEEIDRIGNTLLGLQPEQGPSAAVKERLMQQLHSMKDQTLVVPMFESNNNEETGKLTTMPTRKNAQWLTAAAVAGLIGLTIAVIYLSTQGAQRQSEIASLRQRVQTLNRSVVEQQREAVAANRTLQLLQNDAFSKIKLAAVPGKPQTAAAQVFWNKQSGEVFLADLSLPATPAGKQYQLWAIVDGKPVDAGVLDSPKNTAQQMKLFARADAFAITLEKAGGSAAPTLEEMYVLGKPS